MSAIERCEDCAHTQIVYNSLYGDSFVKLSMPIPTFSWFNRSTAAACWNDPRGARHWAQSIAPRPCMRLDPQGTRTMKQSFASAARLRGDGPILPTASKPWSCSGHRHLGSSSTACHEKRDRTSNRVFLLLDDPSRSGRRPQCNASRDFAGRDHAPQRDEQFAGERHDHRCFARALRTLGPPPVPLRERAVLLEPQEPPGKLDQATAHAGIARLGQPLLPPPLAALVRRAREPGIARHGPSVAKISAEHLLHQHVGRLDANADDAGQEAHHRMWPRRRRLFQTHEAGPFDRVDLLSDHSEPSHVAPDLVAHIRGDRHILWRAQSLEPLR